MLTWEMIDIIKEMIDDIKKYFHFFFIFGSDICV